jgi:outer membrane protein assembly factor BamD (BamD/ComL family)
MGKKHTWTGKHLLLYLTGLVIIAFAILGCLHFSKKQQPELLLANSMHKMLHGQYDEAMEENFTVLNKYPNGLADQALFQIGLLYACPENPNQDYQQALNAFNKILMAFPDSPHRDQAQVWVLFIRNLSEKDRELYRLNAKVVSLEKSVDEQKNNINHLQDQIEKLKGAEMIAFLEKTIKVQKKEITQLREQIEKLKRVDLGIEEKKQKVSQ